MKNFLLNLLVLYLLFIPVFFAFSAGLQWGKTGRYEFVSALVYGATWPAHLLARLN
jgi:hypothetical protein